MVLQLHSALVLIFTPCKLVCGTSPRICDTNHLFLELPLLKDRLEEYIKKMLVDGL